MSSHTFDAVRIWVLEQFENLGAVLEGASFEQINLAELNRAPAKPRDGMVVLADGTNWNPGSGQGFYGYYNGSWKRLG